jgi:hypothetical protein
MRPVPAAIESGDSVPTTHAAKKTAHAPTIVPAATLPASSSPSERREPAGPPARKTKADASVVAYQSAHIGGRGSAIVGEGARAAVKTLLVSTARGARVAHKLRSRARPATMERERGTGLREVSLCSS